MVPRFFTAKFYIGLISLFILIPIQGLNAQEKTVTINWNNVDVVSKTTPTLQVVVNPMLKRNAPFHKENFQALEDLGADYVRFVPWFPYPTAAVVELKEPTDKQTFWDFSYIDPIVEDFMAATEGHSVVMNFSTIPVWMFKTDKPVEIPDDPDKPFWGYNVGNELRDSTMKEVADYFERVFSWYTQGGVTDELGKFHKSGYFYKFQYWEVLNEPDLEHRLSPQQYTKIYDAVVLRLKKISPETKFVGISVAYETNPEWFEYFLNPANHTDGVVTEGISYHFYGRPTYDGLTLDYYQYSFFDQANAFLDRVRYIENIRKRLAPHVFTQINEIGNILLNADYKDPIPNEYWNLSGAMFAYLYVELTKLGIDVAGESQLVGYPTQFPEVSMMNWKNGKPNARFWVLDLLINNLGPGNKIVSTEINTSDVSAQAFITKEGKKLLLINKRNFEVQIILPEEAKNAIAHSVDVSTGDNPASAKELTDNAILLKPFSVALIKFKE